MAVEKFLTFLIAFLVLVAASMLLTYLLDRPQLAAIRESLARSKYKWLAYAIPFSPAVTVAILWLAPRTLIAKIPDVAGAWGVLISSISSATFAAWWLCLPDLPEDSARRTRTHYTALLSVVFWLLDVAVIILVSRIRSQFRFH